MGKEREKRSGEEERAGEEKAVQIAFERTVQIKRPRGERLPGTVIERGESKG